MRARADGEVWAFEIFTTGGKGWEVVLKDLGTPLPMLGGWGGGGRVSEDFVTGREHAKCAGRKGVSGRRSEDFITGREHKKKKKNKCRWEGEGGG